MEMSLFQVITATRKSSADVQMADLAMRLAKLSTTQECQYCQLHFSSAIRNKLDQ